MTQWTPQPARRTGNLWIGMVLGVIVGLMLVGLTWALTVGQPGMTARPSPAVTETLAPVATPTPAPQPTASPAPTATPSVTPTSSATATPSVTPTGLPDGIITELPDGTYLTVLESLRTSSNTPEEALARASRLGNEQYPAVVLDTSSFDGLKPGFYAIVILGAQDGVEAKARCAAVGESFGTDCYVRRIGG